MCLNFCDDLDDVDCVLKSCATLIVARTHFVSSNAHSIIPVVTLICVVSSSFVSKDILTLQSTLNSLNKSVNPMCNAFVKKRT